MAKLSRRDFVTAATAVGAAALPRKASAQKVGQAEIYFLGLCFVRETDRNITIGFLNEPHHHVTIAVAQTRVLPNPLPALGQPPSPEEWVSWNLPGDVGDPRAFTAFKPKKLNLTVMSSTPFVAGLDHLFPATNAGAPLKKWTSSCSSHWTFANGRFVAEKRSETKCKHAEVTWDQTDGTKIQTRNWMLNDVIRMSAQVSKLELDVDGKPVPIDLSLGPVRLWLGNMLHGVTGVDKTEAEHCRHYFSLLEGSPSPFWPKRLQPVPPECTATGRDSDPVFCPPGF